jgi:hypothetical protein
VKKDLAENGKKRVDTEAQFSSAKHAEEVVSFARLALCSAAPRTENSFQQCKANRQHTKATSPYRKFQAKISVVSWSWYLREQQSEYDKQCPKDVGCPEENSF